MNKDNIDLYTKLPIAELDRLQQIYLSRNDAASSTHLGEIREALKTKGSVQTEELYNSGKLIWTRNYDENTGRITHTATGDPAAWMGLPEFSSRGAVGRFDTAMFTGANSVEAKERRARTHSVELQPGESIQIVKK